jgi:hypothetical protein
MPAMVIAGVCGSVDSCVATSSRINILLHGAVARIADCGSCAGKRAGSEQLTATLRARDQPDPPARLPEKQDVAVLQADRERVRVVPMGDRGSQRIVNLDDGSGQRAV